MTPLEELFQRIDAAKVQLDEMRPLDREREQRLMQKFRLWWTYHSNAIEGNSLTQGETEMFLMEGLTAKGKPLKDHLDLRGHSNAVNYLLGFVRDNEVLTEAAMRHLHEVLLVEPYRVPAITLDGLPTTKTVALGQYKTQPNHVRTPTGETHFYAAPEETPAKMQELMEWYRAEMHKGIMHPVEVAARFHHRFTAIHPFDDGNGRMSRLLMNLMLMQKNYAPTVIRISDRDQYLAALRKADGGEHEEFLKFIAGYVFESLNLSLRAAKGEEIDEPTAIQKEIALEILRLKHIEEPEILTRAAQDKLVRECIDPLFIELKKLLMPLCDLFAESYVSPIVAYRPNATEAGELRSSAQNQKIFKLEGMPRYTPNPWTSESVFTQLQFTFELKGFKKARFDTFDLSATLVLKFERLKYELSMPSARPPLTIQHFYQEPLNKDEIQEVSQKLARVFLEFIKKKTNGHL